MRGKRLTRRQKVLLSQCNKRLNINNWLCAAEDADTITLIHKKLNTTKIISKSQEG